MNPNSDPASQKKYKRTLITLAALFMLPIIIAYVGWWQGWFNQLSKTNHGKLLNPVITFEQAKFMDSKGLVPLKSFKNLWWIIYISADKDCQLSCQANAYLINQVRTAQAKETDRVDRLMVHVGNGFSEASKSYVREHFEVHFFTKLSQQSLLSKNKIYLMDPHGNIMLEYDAVKDEKEAVKKGGDLVKDLKKLLKISQIG